MLCNVCGEQTTNDSDICEACYHETYNNLEAEEARKLMRGKSIYPRLHCELCGVDCSLEFGDVRGSTLCIDCCEEVTQPRRKR